MLRALGCFSAFLHGLFFRPFHIFDFNSLVVQLTVFLKIRHVSSVLLALCPPLAIHLAQTLNPY